MGLMPRMAQVYRKVACAYIIFENILFCINLRYRRKVLNEF